MRICNAWDEGTRGKQISSPNGNSLQNEKNNTCISVDQIC